MEELDKSQDRQRETARDFSLPDIELVSAKVHYDWMQTKRAQGIETRKSETGEELMVPYDQLSEKAKDLDRGTVHAVYAAIRELVEAVDLSRYRNVGRLDARSAGTE